MQGVVFKPAPATSDFSCSVQVVLPGRYTEQGAWEAVRAALRTGQYIGGEVRPFVETDAERDVEMRRSPLRSS